MKYKKINESLVGSLHRSDFTENCGRYSTCDSKRQEGNRSARFTSVDRGIQFYGTCTSDVTDRARKAQVAGVKRAREVH